MKVTPKECNTPLCKDSNTVKLINNFQIKVTRNMLHIPFYIEVFRFGV